MKPPDSETTKTAEQTPQADFDSPWKEVIEQYFPSFMELFFPEASADIDWSRPYDFLDKELQQVVRDAELGRRYADKLVRVFRRGGEEVWVLVHIEVQANDEQGFPARMYVYNYRLFDRYNRPVASFAILADGKEGWRPDRFEMNLWDTHVSLRFGVVKLLDLRPEMAALEASTNPFAVVVLAHLRAIETAKAPALRLRWKTELTKMLYDRGRSREDVLNLFRFIDWVLCLPNDLELRFRDTLERLEEERNMPYVTSIERIGIQKGIDQGIEQGIPKGVQLGQSALLRRQVERRFGPLPEWAAKRLEGADRKLLEQWGDRILDAATLDEVFADQ